MKKFFLPLALVAFLTLLAVDLSAMVFTERSEIHASGERVSAGTLLPGETLEGQVDASASERFYALELSQSSRVQVEVASDTSGMILDLLCADGERLEHDVSRPFGRGLSVSYDLMAGSYWLRVSTHDGSAHSYTLTTGVVPAEETFSESWPGDQETAGAFTLAQRVSGQIAQFNPVRQVYDQDQYAFTLDSHTQMLLSFTGDVSVANIQIVDAKQTVYFDRMAYATGLDGDGTSWKISLGAGEYFLLVRSTGYESSGNYSFVLEEQDL